eukprot:TRINITY_DN3992_c0_g1_i1.p2 TRINITY_DN3992_c0_g1~~TRINITY_DN3992_c0_g1_i1.p2  ORF type:complete len:424 (+),score=59.50 TRINITY_DN3992_c0_g1_i1:85-1356(+)
MFRRSSDDGASKDDQYYKLLGVGRDASAADIKRAYKKEAMRHHPDRGGDAAKFKEIQEAYAVLSDPQQRAVYDAQGKQGLERWRQSEQAGAAHDPGDIVSAFFGGARPVRRTRGPTRKLVLEVSLDDMYQGRRVRVRVPRVVQSDPHQAPAPCAQCGGTGRAVHRRARRGMLEQWHVQCGACNGAGFTCELRREEATLHVEIERGFRHGQHVRLPGEAGIHLAGQLPGDLVCVLQQRPHPHLHRAGDHLQSVIPMPLADALCGAPVSVPYLCGKQLRVGFPPGSVVRPGSTWKLGGHGMPVPGTGGTRFGDLLLRFSVHFPARLPAATSAAVARLLRSAAPADAAGAQAPAAAPDGAAAAPAGAAATPDGAAPAAGAPEPGNELHIAQPCDDGEWLAPEAPLPHQRDEPSVGISLADLFRSHL